jgi:hypothetical protein
MYVYVFIYISLPLTYNKFPVRSTRRSKRQEHVREDTVNITNVQ